MQCSSEFDAAVLEIESYLDTDDVDCDDLFDEVAQVLCREYLAGRVNGALQVAIDAVDRVSLGQFDRLDCLAVVEIVVRAVSE